MRGVFHCFVMLVLCVAMTGCFNNEAEERAAFIVWLQTQVVDTPDTRVPVLDDKQREAVGDYAEQYAELVAIDEAIQAQRRHLANAFEHEQLTSLAQLRSRHGALRADQQALIDGQRAVHQALEHLQTQRVKWEQPADLQAVYTQACVKIATRPVVELDAVTTTVLRVLQDTLRVADFIDQHADQITVEADSAAALDPSVQQALNQLLDTLNQHETTLARAYRRFQEQPE